MGFLLGISVLYQNPSNTQVETQRSVEVEVECDAEMDPAAAAELGESRPHLRFQFSTAEMDMLCVGYAADQYDDEQGLAVSIRKLVLYCNIDQNCPV